jgi:tetratricopeptide (TPR) repeat protein
MLLGGDSMADAAAEVVACFEKVRGFIKARDWRALHGSYQPRKADLLLIAAAAAAGAHVADGGDGESELEAIHAADGGAMAKGWPASVKDKAGLFASLMRFSDLHENHHSALPMIDWEAARLEDVVVSGDEATASIASAEGGTEVELARTPGGWRWSWPGDSVMVWGDHPPRGHAHDGPAETPEEDMALAEEALEEGDLAHAARHVAAALAEEPGRREWRDFLDRLADQAKDPLSLFPSEGSAWFGEVAGHAHVLAHRGDTQQALDTIALVGAHVPGRGYPLWIAEWLGRHEGRFDPRGLLGTLARLGQDTVGFLRLRPSERAIFENWAPVALAILAREGDELRAETLMIVSGILRRAGRLPDAIRAAKASFEVSETSMAASALGLALRASRDWEGALAAFRRGQELDPESPFAAECVRVHVDSGRLDEAARELSALPEGDPENDVLRAWLSRKLGDGARPKTGWLRGVFAPEKKKVHPAVLACAGRLPDECDADAFRNISVHGVPEPPLPADATSNVVRQFHAQPKGSFKAGDKIGLTIDGLEAPSGRLALALELGGDGSDFSMIEYEVKAIQEPDPRRPRRPVRDVIWIYSGTDERPEVRQTLHAPPAEVGRVVSELAASPYFLPAWWSRARKEGPGLGPSRVDDVLGAMVHPPRPPAGMDAVEWVFKNQLAGAFLLAHVDAGWEGSRRREVLFSLVDGVMDWTTDAAILALRELALDEPELLDEVEGRFWTLRDEAPREGHPWFLVTLAWSYLRLPGTPADRRQAFEEDLESFRDG